MSEFLMICSIFSILKKKQSQVASDILSGDAMIDFLLKFTWMYLIYIAFGCPERLSPAFPGLCHSN